MRIALCPTHGTEMALVHTGVEMNAWHCDACGFVHSITPDGEYVASTDNREDTPLPHYIKWVERRHADPRFGRIANMEGG